MSFTLLFDPPGPEAKALAVKELRETEENVRKGLETLKKYLEGWRIYHFSQFNPEVRNLFESFCSKLMKSSFVFSLLKIENI